MRNLQNIQVRTGSGFETVCPFPVGAIYQSTSSQVQPASMAEGGHLSQMVDSLDRKGLGIILAEKMRTNSLSQKCQAIFIIIQLYYKGIVNLELTPMECIKPMHMIKDNFRLGLRAVMPHITTFPHTEHATAGIELPNILGGVLC